MPPTNKRSFVSRCIRQSGLAKTDAQADLVMIGIIIVCIAITIIAVRAQLDSDVADVTTTYDSTGT